MASEPLQRINSVEMSIGAALKLARNLQALEEVTKEYDTRRMALVNKYGVEEGDNISIPEKHLATFNESINKIIDEKVELNINLLSYADLSDDIKITPSDLYALMWLFEMDEAQVA